MPLFVVEDRSWVKDPAENRQYQRIARAWNRIHHQMLEHPDAATTSIFHHRNVFFRFDGELLLAEEFWPEQLFEGIPYALSLGDFEGQSEEDLSELADAMEQWLEKPDFLPADPSHRMISEDIRARRDYAHLATPYLRPGT